MILHSCSKVTPVRFKTKILGSKMKSMKSFIVVTFLISVICISTICSQDIIRDRESEESNIPQNVLRKYKVRRTKTVDTNGNIVISSQRVRKTKPNTNARKINQEAENVQQLDAQFLSSSPDDQSIIEPMRTIPNRSRKPTSSQERAKLLGSNNRYRSHKPDFGTSTSLGRTRSYSRTNLDGSFTFGYEGDDGSFKEETRGTDCIVRGKYGYIDPDGFRREFAYTSGNPCDPKQKSIDSDEDENSIPERSQGVQVLSHKKPLLRRPITGFLEERFPAVQTQHEQAEIIITPPPPPTSAPLIQTTVNYELNKKMRQRVRRPKPTGATVRVTAETTVPGIHRQVDGKAAQLKNSLPIVIPAASSIQNRHNRGFNFEQEPEQSTLARNRNRIRGNARQRNSPGNYRTELIYDQQSGQYTSVLLQNIPGAHHNPLSDSVVYNHQLPPQILQHQQQQALSDPVYTKQKEYYEAQEYLRRRESELGRPTMFPQFHRAAGVISGF